MWRLKSESAETPPARQRPATLEMEDASLPWVGQQSLKISRQPDKCPGATPRLPKVAGAEAVRISTNPANAP